MNKRILSILFLITSLLSAQEPDPLAEMPSWPVGLKWPRDLVDEVADDRFTKATSGAAADILLWIPPDAKHIRAILLIANNTDLVKIGEYTSMRAVAARHGMAICYLKNFSGNVIEWRKSKELMDKSFQVLFRLAAEKTGIPEFRFAPWVTLGKSSRGRFPFQCTWAYPDRVVASISYHGEVPTWPMADWSEAGGDESPLHLNIQGLTEWDGTWYRHVRPGLLNYNHHTQWLSHQVVIYGVDHGYYMDYYLYPNFGANLEKEHKFIRATQVWDYISLFVDTALDLKIDTSAYPGNGPVALKPVSREGGYLIHPRAPEELLGTKWFALRKNDEGIYQTIPWPEEKTPVWDTEQGMLSLPEWVKPVSAVPLAEQADYLWIPNRKLLQAWLGLHNLYKKADEVLMGLPE